jgi:hypothetical protein
MGRNFVFIDFFVNGIISKNKRIRNAYATNTRGIPA